MKSFTEENLTEEVLDKMKCENPRTQEIVSKLIKHLHAFIRDLEPTEAEWGQAIDFLTRTGQISDDKRQEFILLSDVLGVSMLVDAINHRHPGEATETTVTGPFHAPARHYEMGENIAKGAEAERGKPLLVHGRILDTEGHPINGATIEVWQSDDQGFYDIQPEGNQPEMNLRGIFVTAEHGDFAFRSILPVAYPVPTDGPVGELLNATGRHPMRPAHIHFWIKAEGHAQLITHIFPEGSDYLDSDAVFGVKASLVLPFDESKDEVLAEEFGMPVPFHKVRHDFKLAKL